MNARTTPAERKISADSRRDALARFDKVLSDKASEIVGNAAYDLSARMRAEHETSHNKTGPCLCDYVDVWQDIATLGGVDMLQRFGGPAKVDALVAECAANKHRMRTYAPPETMEFPVNPE